jgi:hypothetical protein
MIAGDMSFNADNPVLNEIKFAVVAQDIGALCDEGRTKRAISHDLGGIPKVGFDTRRLAEQVECVASMTHLCRD